MKTQIDLYSDLGEVYAEETAQSRARVRPTPRTPTEQSETDDSASSSFVPGLDGTSGYHIDGDKRYE